MQGSRVRRPEPRPRLGDKVLVKESAYVLHRDGVHPTLVRVHFTAPWLVLNIIRAGLNFTVRLNGRTVRQRKVSATDMKPFHS